MKATYTKTTAKRLLPFATKIESVREFKNCIQITYWCNGGRCSTFLSKKAFVESNTQLRVVGAIAVEVTDVIDDHFIVKSKDNCYVVRPNHFNPRERCECGDCQYRGAKCKHQIAVEQFLNQKFSLSEMVAA